VLKDLKYAFEDILRERGVPIEVVLDALEAALVSAYKKDNGKEIFPKFKLAENGKDVEVYLLKEVVDDVEDSEVEILLDDAKVLNPNAGMHEMVETDGSHLDFSFGRIAAQSAKQVVMQRIKEAERGIVFEEFKDRVGQLVTGKIRRREKGNIIVELDKHEGIMPPIEQVDGEKYIPKTTLKAIIKEVTQTPKGPKVILSRAHPDFVKRLFELEVPEIADGTVEVKRIAREVGSRTKMAVASNSTDVDPVGACVGSKGSRVQAVVNELKGENIDIIHYTDDPFDFIANALAPARVYSVEIFDEEESAEVIVPDDQVSLAIGKNGQNVRLAAKLTGWHIDIRKESDKFELEMKAIAEDRQVHFRVLMEGKLDVLPLRKTAFEALAGAGIETVRDILDMGPDGLLTVKGFGEQALKNVQTFLAREGISFENYLELLGEDTGEESKVEESKGAEAEVKVEAKEASDEEPGAAEADEEPEEETDDTEPEEAAEESVEEPAEEAEEESVAEESVEEEPEPEEAPESTDGEDEDKTE
jgi:N utilization substance protein A